MADRPDGAVDPPGVHGRHAELPRLPPEGGRGDRALLEAGGHPRQRIVHSDGHVRLRSSPPRHQDTKKTFHHQATKTPRRPFTTKTRRHEEGGGPSSGPPAFT